MSGIPVDISKNLSLDEWYKFFIWLGVIGILGAFFIPIKITLISGDSLAISSFGLILIGSGEWMKWKHSTSENGPLNAYVLHTKDRTSYMSKRPNGTEDLIQFIGLILLVAPFILPLLPRLSAIFSQ